MDDSKGICEAARHLPAFNMEDEAVFSTNKQTIRRGED
ncbi:MAG: hypothetical protein BWX75_00630 [Candidatus Cloacimonetes bacterium ADurb.Bin088]|jgi:hypothetical protein|nr:MAG: hypothetical protein BWX75_00630 [Candidatus Cloacimonetes bacterium ADurb.Bin088]